MGQGLAEVGANIARSTMAGYEGLSKGISAVSDAYKEKKKLDAQNKADEGFVKTMMPYLPESIRNDFAARHEDLMSDPSASALDKAAFYHSAKSYLGQSVAHTMDMEKIAQSAAYNPAWSEVDAKNEYYRALAEQARRKAEYGGKDVSTFFTNTPAGTPTSNPVMPSGEVLSVTPTYEGNLPVPEKQKPYRLQMGLPTGYGEASMGLFGR